LLAFVESLYSIALRLSNQLLCGVQYVVDIAGVLSRMRQHAFRACCEPVRCLQSWQSPPKDLVSLRSELRLTKGNSAMDLWMFSLSLDGRGLGWGW